MTITLLDHRHLQNLTNTWLEDEEGASYVDVDEQCVGDEVAAALFLHFIKAHKNPIQTEKNDNKCMKFML